MGAFPAAGSGAHGEVDYYFLFNKLLRGKLGENISSSRFTSNASPQGYILSPLLVYLYTNNCVSLHLSVKLLKSADDTTHLISKDDEWAYKMEIERLQSWCNNYNLELCPLKTVEMRVDFQ